MTLLSLLIKVIFVHGYMPYDMMCTTIIPLLKDKVGDITDKHNYRPIALATVAKNYRTHNFTTLRTLFNHVS